MQREAQRHKLLTRRAAILAAGQATLRRRSRRAHVPAPDPASRTATWCLPTRTASTCSCWRRRAGASSTASASHWPTITRTIVLVIVPEQAGDIAATLDALAGLIEVGDADRRRVLRDVRRKHPFVPVVVRANLSWDEMAHVEVAIPELPGVSIEQGLTPILSIRRDHGARHRLCRRGFGGGADWGPAARAAGFSHRQERGRKVAGRRTARQCRDEPGRGQRLWPRRARARPRPRQARART